MLKRRSILEASMKLIVKKGLHAVTMAEIAQEAQVGIGTIYKHFKDKDAIVQQLWIHQKEEEAAFIFTQYTDTDGVKERFWFLWKRVIRYFITHQDAYYFSYHFAASPILNETIHEQAMSEFLAFDEMFQEGIEAGLFKENLSARQLRLYTFSTVNGWILWSFDENVHFSETKIEQFVTMAWDAIRD